MGQTLTHGVYLPDEGERNCYNGLAGNWNILDGAVGTIAEHTTALASKAPAVHTHTKSDITDFPAYGTTAGTICEGNDSRLSDARTPVAHTHTKSDVTDLLNSNFIPSANNSYDLGSSSYQWNNVYAKGYYYNGVAWGLDKENVWTGNNRFSKNSALSDITSYTDTSISFTGNSNTIFFNTRGSSNYASFGTFLFAGYMSGSAPDRYGQLKLLRSTDLKGGTNDGYVPDTSFNLWRVAPHYLLMDIMEAVRVQNNGTSNYIAPITTNVTDLGTSTNKWKSLNGINPGALSLPDISNSMNVDTTGWVTDGGAWNTITSSNLIDGYLYINYSQCSADDYIAVRMRTSSYQNLTFCISANTTAAGNHFLYASVPVSKQFYVFLEIKTTGTLQKACIFPMQGNV